MRFLGHGIGHKSQTKSVASSNRSGDKGKGADKSKPPKPHNAARGGRHQGAPLRHKVVEPEDNVQDGEDNESNSSEDGSDADSDDLEGCF